VTSGLEIVHGQIGLVRWPDDGGRPVPEIFASADLRHDVFAAV